MLKLQNIKKTYELGGGNSVEALKGIDISFRQNEFVSILGPSGCGKTTLLNVIGGLDHPTDGVLEIGGVSTEKYSDRDWDTYRNHSIGFVFQTYNLIPHMNVLANVEMAPTISGAGKSERREKSIKALEKVGLGDQLNKKPNQLSGGQMQRVAIARALVNDPEILLADEPTGALDTETSVQIMELLKEVARDRLVIMVTHNPDLAAEYSTRIVNLKDGRVVGDSAPYNEQEEPAVKEQENTAAKDKKQSGKKKASMSFITALSLSMRNLISKKGRAILTSFAGSIGIIGIALILAISNGVTSYIDQVQEDTLSTYPISVDRYTSNTGAMLQAMAEARKDAENVEVDDNLIYPDDSMGSMFSALTSIKEHDLPLFKKYFEENYDKIASAVTAYSYSYNLTAYIYAANVPGYQNRVMRTNPTSLFDYMGSEIQTMMSSMAALAGSSVSSSNSLFGLDFYTEILEGAPDKDGSRALINPLVKTQYELIGENSRWPENAEELVLVVDQHNRIAGTSLYALGFMDPDNIEELIRPMLDPSAEYQSSFKKGDNYPIDDFLGVTYYLVDNTAYYYYDEDYLEKNEYYTAADGKNYPIWKDVRNDDDYNEEAFFNSLKAKGAVTELKIVGVVRRSMNAASASISAPIGYTAALSRKLQKANNASAIAQQQIKTSDFDVFTGKRFESNTDLGSTYLTAIADLLNRETLAEILPLMQDDVIRQVTEKQEINRETVGSYIKAVGDDDLNRITANIKAMLNQKGLLGLFTIFKDVDTDKIVGALMAGLDRTTLSKALVMLSDDLFKELTGDTGLTKKNVATFIENATDEQLDALIGKIKTVLSADTSSSMLSYFDFSKYGSSNNSDNNYTGNLVKFGYCDDSTLRSIRIYAADFASKDVIADFINEYNNSVSEDKQVEITDVVGSLLTGINTVINVISYVLIAFVAISLIVSSIMIAIITYISVLERTKEIGILRSLGASKKNIRNVFNAETLIEGFAAGLLGVLITLILCLIVNPILHALSGMSAINASLPLPAALILIAISMLLTLVAGLIPAHMASKKDPVIALRTE